MARPDILKQVRARIEHAAPGDVFIPADFSDLAEARKITMCLSRLRGDGTLEKVKRGVYRKPRFRPLLDQPVPPREDAVAKAIARNYGWTIVPCGDTALNMLGLSTQIPAVWLYVSDGPYKTYETDGIIFQFKHTDRKNELIGVSETTALIIQALRAMGKETMDSQTISFLSSRLDAKERRQILQESRYVAAWIYEAIKEICGDSEA
ncbi:MAG: hypothetical protein J6A42_02365 [Firmicutes bacterium]|nr:hypothetical protein [Bacillota bacterium]